MDEQLQQLIDLQKEQVELLKKHLWRLRYSLSTLLLLTTGSCIALGYVAYWIRTSSIPVPVYYSNPTPVRVGVAGEPAPPIPTPTYELPYGTRPEK
jgi:hypothetical protein